MKALDQGMNFSSFGASSKNILDFDIYISRKETIRKECFPNDLIFVSWTSLPDVNCEKSAAYGCSATNWEYIKDNSSGYAATTGDGFFIFVAYPKTNVQLEYNKSFKIEFEHNFGVSYDVWKQKNGDIFMMDFLDNIGHEHFYKIKSLYNV